MGGFELVALTVIGLFVTYKLGGFLIVRNIADVAVVASEKYKEEAWVEGVQSRQDLGITTEEIQKSMENRAIIKSLMEQDLRGSLRVPARHKPSTPSDA